MERAILKCRLCLKNRKRLHSLYDATEGTTYADIVATISNVKASKNDGFPEDICFGCSKTLKEIYQYKLLIESSHIELQKTYQLKKINDIDINDTDCEFDEPENHEEDYPDNFEISLPNRIKRRSTRTLKSNNTDQKKCSNDDKKSLSAKEFLESIQTDPDNDYNIVFPVAVDYEPNIRESDNNESTKVTNDECYKKLAKQWQPVVSSDEDYDPKKYKNNKYKRKSTNKELIPQQVIKPVYLKDFRLVHTKARRPPKNNENKIREKTKKYICPICGVMFTSLKHHILTHGEKEHKCELCPKTFYSKHGLLSHKKNHSGRRDHKCGVCFSTFVQPVSLKLHMRLHTEPKKSYPCEECGKKFNTVWHQQRHWREVHNRDSLKTIQCDHCEMYFVSNCRLRHHLRVHTGERPFKCEICSQPYSYKADFIRHCFKKHNVFLKGRPVKVLNEETLIQERNLMRDLLLRVQGVIQDDDPTNPFEGPHAFKAFEQAVKALETNKITVDL